MWPARLARIMDDIEIQIRARIANGKCKQAVELAKDHHKRVGSADSQQLLVEAYVARIEQFQNQGMAEDARTLLSLVQERFPTARTDFDTLQLRADAVSGRVEKLLAALASDQISPARRTLIESLISRYVTDLPALASCTVLPADHPLRTAAQSTWSAFSAVTSRPVTDAEIDLPEVSRHSAFAAWKLLIRAIAAFYRGDDSVCRRALDAIAPDSAISQVAATVRALVDGQRPVSGMPRVLFDRVRSSDRPLREALHKIDLAFQFFDTGRLRAGIRESLQLCASLRPELLTTMKQRIAVSCMLNQVPAEHLNSVLATTIQNASFWHLIARAYEVHGAEARSAWCWERFLQHAVDEKLFAANSGRAAAVWLHIAELLSPLSRRELEFSQNRLRKLGVSPAGVSETHGAIGAQVIDPGRAFREATAIRPESETFKKWWSWAQRVKLPPKLAEDIAMRWSQLRPNDAQPLLHLSSLAEARNALTLATKRLNEAERLDPMNQQVRRAKVRLALGITWRHFAEGKVHLVGKDIEELSALPGMVDGDRAAVLQAIRGAHHLMRGDSAGENECFKLAADRIGFLATSIIFGSVGKMARLAEPSKPLALPTDESATRIAQAQATAVRLGEDLSLKICVPAGWARKITEALRERPCPLSNNDIQLLGRGALKVSQFETAYLASSAGLARSNSPAITARFLLLRANSLTEFWQHRRAVQCLRAALELARQANDQQLISDVFAAIDDDVLTRRSITHGKDGQSLSAELLLQILNAEKLADAYPREVSQIASSMVLEVTAPPSNFFGDTDQADFDWDDADDDDDAFDSDNDLFPGEPGLFESDDVPSGVSPEEMICIAAMLEKLGITSPEQILSNPSAVIEAMAKSMGRKVGDAEKRVLNEELRRITAAQIEGSRPTGSGGGSHQKKKKRR